MSSEELISTQSAQIAKIRAKARRSRDSQMSLSTIAEEPKSYETGEPESNKISSEEKLKKGSKQTISSQSTSELCHCKYPSPSKEKRDESASTLQTSPSVPSMLVKGFGLRNLASLQASLDREERKLKELYKAQERQQQSYSMSSSTETDNLSKSLSSTSQEKVDTPCGTEVQSLALSVQGSASKNRLMYLMGLMTGDDEEEEEGQTSTKPLKKDSGRKDGSIAMRKAQTYLKTHRIFEFFQFLIAHLLGGLPDNPIEFLIDLLNQCMIFRSGIPTPPLLYEYKHLDALFNLMDRMRTGYIDIEQYKTGMRTLGICSFNNDLPLTSNNMVSKEVFIEEATLCLMHTLNEMIKRQWTRKTTYKEPPLQTPSTMFGGSEIDIPTDRDNYILGAGMV